MVFYWVVKELVFLLRKHGIDLGRQTFQDATDIRALKHDDEAHYSGYYKESGNKLDVTIDAERDVPLHYITLEITDDEGKNLIPSQEHLTSLGIQTKEHIVHDKYATYENIARSETHGTTMIYTIAKNWCITPVVPLMVLNSFIRGITRRMILSLVLILSSCCITCARKVKLRLSELSLGISGWLKQRRTQKDMNRNAMNEEAALKDSSVG
jgi:hypothetical protein